MPNCLPASGPQAWVSASKDQPCAPMAKPCAKRIQKAGRPERPAARARARCGRARARAARRRRAAARRLGSSQVRPCRSACSSAGALSLAGEVAQPRRRQHRRVQRVPRHAQEADGADGEPERERVAVEAHRARRVDFLLPALEQALALGGRAVLGDVVVDDLDVGEIRNLRRQRHVAVGRDRVFLDVEPDLLRVGGQRPVEEFLRVVEVARALDDRHRADLVADALAGQDRLDRKAAHDLVDHAVQDGAADADLAARDRGHRSDAGARVLVDVGVERLHVA